MILFVIQKTALGVESKNNGNNSELEEVGDW